jgi:hypothetical protein
MDIFQTIRETATWLENVNNNFETNLFRTGELSPKHYYCEIPDKDKPAVVKQIIDRRSELLQKANEVLIPVEKLGQYGRIMFFDANSTVLDGAPEEQSSCYVDIADTPPWDTWIATGTQLNALNIFQQGHKLKDDLLIAWVPKSQYYFANAALEVACLDNFKWGANDYITNDYSSLKELFSAPGAIETSNEFVNYNRRIAMLETIQSELNINSELYYRRFRAKVANKGSFWHKLTMWKTWFIL